MGLVGSFALLFAFFLVWAVLAPYERHPYKFFVARTAERVRKVGKKVRRGSIKAVKSMAKRLSSAGSVDMGSGTPSPPRKAKSLPNPQPSPTHDAFGPPMPSPVSSFVVRRSSASQHKRGWSEPSVTVEGDGDPPGTMRKGSLDVGQVGGALKKEETGAWEGKAVKFDSLV